MKKKNNPKNKTKEGKQDARVSIAGRRKVASGVMNSIGITCEGKSVGYQPIPEILQDAMNMLNKLKFKSLIKTDTLCDKIGLDRELFMKKARPYMGEYRIKNPANVVQWLWGSQKTIAFILSKLEEVRDE